MGSCYVNCNSWICPLHQPARTLQRPLFETFQRWSFKFLLLLNDWSFWMPKRIFLSYLLCFCIFLLLWLVSVHFSSVAQSSLCDHMACSTPGFPVHHQHPELAQTHIHWVGDVIQPSHPLPSLLLLPSIFPSIRVFSNESVLCIWWPNYWSFSFSISPSNEYPGLISFRMDWLDLLTVQGTLKSLLQHHSSKASIIWCSAIFRFQLSSKHDC